MIEIEVQKVANSRISEVDLQNPAFGREFTDHMFIADYYDGEWKDARIVPFGKFEVSPGLSAFHYGQAIFEGMKAFKSSNDSVSLFRPLENFERFNRSAVRMCMPEVPEELFMQGLTKWVDLDRDWIPNGKEGALYVRPFMIATDDYLGVMASTKYRFMIYGCPVNAYYRERLRVKIEQKYVRAVVGGVGAAKTAGNYAASLYAQNREKKNGFHQLLWTDAFEHKYLEELGTSNFFAFIDNRLVTPELDGTILDGITRDSVIQLCRNKGIEVIEKRFSVDELIDALKSGRATECFASGTAAVIAEIGAIGWQNEVFELSEVEDGIVANISKELKAIQHGDADDLFGWRYSLDSARL